MYTPFFGVRFKNDLYFCRATTKKKSNMAAIDLRIEIPDATTCDLELLRKQLTAFARILITSVPKVKVTGETKTDDPFACFSGSWGDETKSAQEVADELRNARCFNHPTTTW